MTNPNGNQIKEDTKPGNQNQQPAEAQNTTDHKEETTHTKEKQGTNPTTADDKNNNNKRTKGSPENPKNLRTRSTTDHQHQDSTLSSQGYPQILRDERDFGPAHFALKIESYSLLSKAPHGHGKRYESGIFDVEGYKWKLILYPQGDKTCEGKGNISLYVAIDESNSFPNNNWIVCAYLKFFVLNQKTKKYLTIQEAKGALKHFDNLRTEHGCSQLISHDKLNDPCNGYLVNDCYVFGVEVFVIQPSFGNEETLTMVKEPNGRTYTWSIKNFSKLNDNLLYSNEFIVGGRKWNLKLFPKGNKSDMGKSLSLYLWLSDWKSVIPKRKVYAEYRLRVVDHSRINKVEKQASHWFDSNQEQGFSNLISIKELHELDNGYLNDDTLIVEVEFDVISVTKVRKLTIAV